MTERERAEFEAWADDPANPLPVQKHEFGRYDCERACAWGAWQAARLEERKRTLEECEQIAASRVSPIDITLEIRKLLAALEKGDGNGN
jgi:hypothetical protein